MKTFFLNMNLFEKNRKIIENKNFMSLRASGMTFVVISLIECFFYLIVKGDTKPLVLVIYDLVVAALIVALSYLHKSSKDVSVVFSVLWYFVGITFVCHSRYLHTTEACLFNYALITLILCVILLLQPFTLILINFICLFLVCINEFMAAKGDTDGFVFAKYTIVFLLDLIIGFITIYLRMENLVFENELFLSASGEDDELVNEHVDAHWSGRNKYGILSGDKLGHRKVFAFVFSISKERLVNIREGNIWGLSAGMKWDEVRERILESVMDPASRKRLLRMMDLGNMQRSYNAGRKRLSTVAGFNFNHSEKKWFDFECSLKTHPISGELFGTLFIEDITEDRILMGVFNKIVEQNYDFVMCIEGENCNTVTFQVEPGDEIQGEYGDDYNTEIRRFIQKYVADYDVERVEFLTKKETVALVLGKEKMHEFLLDEVGEDGAISKKLLRYSYLDPSHNFLCLIKQDVTDVIRKEDEAKARLAEALREREKAMNARSEFMTRMSHEMRTPMNAILGLSSLMMDEINNPEAMRDYIGKIQYSGQFLLQLINDVLDISKMQQDKFVVNAVSYSMTDFWEAIDTMIRPMCIKKGVEFEWKSSVPTNYSILTDPLRITQVFINLLSNAIKYTPKGGHISFECREQSKEGNVAKLVFNVKDDGIGMSEEFQKHMFEAFVQESKEVNSDLNGTGLGLSIVKGIVEALEGEIKVESKSGAGTNVEVTFNLEVKEDEHKKVSTDFDKDISGKRVLVVEDNDINREIAVAILEKKGIISEIAVNGQEAVEKFASHTPDYYDLILMDIRMPVMNGLTATKRIRAMERDDAKTIPIVAMTANAFGQDVEASFEAGLNEHLSKPIDPKVLYKTIAKYTTE